MLYNTAGKSDTSNNEEEEMLKLSYQNTFKD